MEKDPRKFADQVVGEFQKENMLETIRKFNTLYRYTGYPEGEAAAAYIKENWTSTV